MTPERRRPERSRRIPGLPACFEAARVRQKAKIFHELNHDTYKIALLPANASLWTIQAPCEGRRRLAKTAGLRLFCIDAASAKVLHSRAEAAIKTPQRHPADFATVYRSEINCKQPPCWTRP